MYKLTVTAFLLAFSLRALATIVIHDLSGEDSVPLGNSTTLKCDYECQDEEGVVVKWFYNKDVLISQWIPDHGKPIITRPLKDLLEVTANTLHFEEVTLNLTGDYTCQVSTLTGEESKTRRMVVYKPAELVDINLEELTQAVICSVYEIYPEPNITVSGSVSRNSTTESVLLELVDENIVITEEDEFFNVTKIFRFSENGLRDAVFNFVCDISLPHTKYTEKRTLEYNNDDLSN